MTSPVGSGFAVLGIRRARRLRGDKRRAMVDLRLKKRSANRAYRRSFKQAVGQGIESVSEFDPPHGSLLTGWDII